MSDKCYIYVLYSKKECIVRYIGVSVNPSKRFKAHVYSSLNIEGREYNLYKNKWIRTVDDLAMKVVFAGSSKECYKLEEVLISKYKESRRLKNTTPGGDKPPALNELSKSKYKETVAKIKAKAQNRTVSEETRQKMSVAQKKIYKPHLKLFNKGADNPRARKVSQYNLNGDLIKVWDYANQAIQELGLNRTAITDCIRGRQKTAGGYIWKLYSGL